MVAPVRLWVVWTEKPRRPSDLTAESAALRCPSVTRIFTERGQLHGEHRRRESAPRIRAGAVVDVEPAQRVEVGAPRIGALHRRARGLESGLPNERLDRRAPVLAGAVG